ncbi:MAG: methyltransferase family protein [Candidatus Hodarchaeales archaeon]|jgi:protein-S-isoprenylcysteine O-methyltransferase Ste14
MSAQYQSGLGIEHPYSHQIMIGSTLFFFITWLLDTFLVQLFVDLRNGVPLIIRIFLFVVTVGFSFILMNTSQKKIFSQSKSQEGLVSDGVYALVRHPLYLSIPGLYLAFTFLSFSVLSLLSIIVIFYFFNKMVEFEEKELVNILGDVYSDYMIRVPRWIPRLSAINELIFLSNDN